MQRSTLKCKSPSVKENILTYIQNKSIFHRFLNIYHNLKYLCCNPNISFWPDSIHLYKLSIAFFYHTKNSFSWTISKTNNIFSTWKILTDRHTQYCSTSIVFLKNISHILILTNTLSNQLNNFHISCPCLKTTLFCKLSMY